MPIRVCLKMYVIPYNVMFKNLPLGWGLLNFTESRVGPVDTVGSIAKLNKNKKKKGREKTRERKPKIVTCDTWYATCDTWQLTPDWWWTLCQHFRSLSLNGLGVMMFWRFGGKEWLTLSINDESVCRTAPSTLGSVKHEKYGHFSLDLKNLVINFCFLFDSIRATGRLS